MRTTTTPVSSRPFGRRVMAAAAALGVAVTLTACSPGGDDGEGAAADQSSSAGADGSGENPGSAAGSEDPAAGAGGTGEDGAETVAEEPGSAPEGRPAGAPDTPIEELVLGGQDAPEYSLVTVPASQLAESVKAMSGFADGAKVEPPHCADLNQSTMEAQAAPGTTALATGTAGQAPVSVAVSTVTKGIEDQRGMAERCPSMTMTLDMEGAQATVESRNTIEDVPAPAGVEHFVAISQESSANIAGQTQTTSGYTVNGVVRGIGVTVSTMGANGPTSPEARDAAMALFTKQVEKIRNA